MEEIVGRGIDGSVQPVPFVGAPNHGPINRDPTRSAVVNRLSIDFLNPVMNRGATPYISI